MTDDQIESLLAEVRETLKGIDSRDDDDGWWETSVGVKFGAERLATLEALLRERLKA